MVYSRVEDLLLTRNALSGYSYSASQNRFWLSNVPYYPQPPNVDGLYGTVQTNVFNGERASLLQIGYYDFANNLSYVLPSPLQSHEEIQNSILPATIEDLENYNSASHTPIYEISDSNGVKYYFSRGRGSMYSRVEDVILNRNVLTSAYSYSPSQNVFWLNNVRYYPQSPNIDGLYGTVNGNVFSGERASLLQIGYFDTANSLTYVLPAPLQSHEEIQDSILPTTISDLEGYNSASHRAIYEISDSNGVKYYTSSSTNGRIYSRVEDLLLTRNALPTNYFYNPSQNRFTLNNITYRLIGDNIEGVYSSNGNIFTLERASLLQIGYYDINNAFSRLLSPSLYSQPELFSYNVTRVENLFDYDLAIHNNVSEIRLVGGCSLLC